MEPVTTVETLEGFTGRGAGTDAERRAALWLAGELSQAGHESIIETFWCRPNWPMTHAWHVALAIAGSLVAVASPIAGITLLGVAVISTVADALASISIGRRLTPERASQNVISTASSASPSKTRLILTANYDAGRAALAYRDAIRKPAAALKRAVRGFTPGWLGWIVIAMLWLLAVALLRLGGHKSVMVGALQLPPTIGLVLAFALLLDLVLADFSPAAGDNASGVAVALALAQALAETAPKHVDVELVLTGAGDGEQIGLRHYLRRRRRDRTPANTVVLGLAASGGGRPRWWSSDGSLVPLRYARSMRDVARRIAVQEPHFQAAPHKGRGAAPGLPARYAGLPAIAVGCLAEHGLAPRAHRPEDRADSLDASALDMSIQFALLLVDAVDAVLAGERARRSATPA